jgi:hypothetical protein
MHAMMPVGIPGTTITEGRGRKGKGVSEPNSTRGCRRAGGVGAGATSASSSARICSAKYNVGPMPAPSPINRRRGLSATRPYYVGQHGHPDGDAVAHLVANDGLLTVRYVGGDLDSAVHRLRVHHDGVGAG